MREGEGMREREERKERRIGIGNERKREGIGNGEREGRKEREGEREG